MFHLCHCIGETPDPDSPSVWSNRDRAWQKAAVVQWEGLSSAQAANGLRCLDASEVAVFCEITKRVSGWLRLSSMSDLSKRCRRGAAVGGFSHQLCQLDG